MGNFAYGNKSSQKSYSKPYQGANKYAPKGSSVLRQSLPNRNNFKTGSEVSTSPYFRKTITNISSGNSRPFQSGGSYRSSGKPTYHKPFGNPRFTSGQRGGNQNRSTKGARARFNFDEKMFVKKSVVESEKVEYVPTFKFEDLNIHSSLKKNIRLKNFNIPTPIQDQSIIHIINAKDLLGIADTGTGKTAAFLIPLIDKVARNPRSKVLIITPTRELADQINQDLYALTRDMRIFSVQCIGGCNINNQISNLRRGYSFVIGTPGRLKDLFNRKVLNLAGFDTVVLDEVDRMLDMGFVNEIKHLISFLPTDRQSLCFSATVDRKVEGVINVILKKDYIKVSVKTGETAEYVEQDIVRIERHEDKIPKLESLLSSDGFDKVLIFANTKRQVDQLNKHLYGKGYKVESIHGDRRQNERKRSIENFKAGRSSILVATDVAARGLDIHNITHVINFDIPMQYEDYIHRVGRTGRANKKGYALTFVERSKSRY